MKKELVYFMFDYANGTIQNTLAPYLRLYKDNVVLTVAPLFNTAIDLQWICSMTPGQGKATEAMKWLIALADKHQVKLCLFAVPKRTQSVKAPMSKPKLIAWYRTFGFRVMDGQDAMERMPK